MKEHFGANVVEPKSLRQPLKEEEKVLPALSMSALCVHSTL
jgi:hypothetical protein